MDDLKARLKEKIKDNSAELFESVEETIEEKIEETIEETIEENVDISNGSENGDIIEEEDVIEGIENSGNSGIEESGITDVEENSSEDIEEKIVSSETLSARDEYFNDLDLINEEGINIDNINLVGDFCDSNGNPIEKQKEGKLGIKYLELDDIHIPPRARLFNLELDDLEESIHMWGLIEPLHVIPYKDEEGEVKYILVHGYRRYLACQGLAMDTVPCIVDTTRPKEVVRYLEVINNNTRGYNFAEMMEFGRYVEERQKGFSHETIENILGLPKGLYLKGKYVDSARNDFPDIYEKVLKNKMTVDAAFKKIEKEIEKGNESPLESLNRDGLPGGGTGGADAYDTIEREEHTQTKGERHILDPAIRKNIEGRDRHCCQSCGLGKDDHTLSAIFNVHHMVPVKNQGADVEENLILLCPNCHGYVHGIETRKFRPNKDMISDKPYFSNIVLLANIIIRGLPIEYNGDAYRLYAEKASRPFLYQLQGETNEIYSTEDVSTEDVSTEDFNTELDSNE